MSCSWQSPTIVYTKVSHFKGTYLVMLWRQPWPPECFPVGSSIPSPPFFLLVFFWLHHRKAQLTLLGVCSFDLYEHDPDVTLPQAECLCITKSALQKAINMFPLTNQFNDSNVNEFIKKKYEQALQQYFMVTLQMRTDFEDPLVQTPYLKATTESADFIQSHLFNVRKIVQDTISARENDSCAVSASIAPTNSGVMIQGLAILSSMQNLLDEFLTAVIPNSVWQGRTELFYCGLAWFYEPVPEKTGDVNLVQGFAEAYRRNTASPSLRRYIGQYFAVQNTKLIRRTQFNAVTDFATSGGTNVYAGSWKGPPSAAFSANNQTIALAALISAIGLDEDDPSSLSFSNRTSAQKIGAIIGGILSGVALLSDAGRVDEKVLPIACTSSDGFRDPPVHFGTRYPTLL
ncbi:hypothetical protein C8R43DRAFT_956081 [Mycena crocata]|nr:hypothetical protein C8R43DRAFT_956081 [Mycena crocata]